MPKLNELTLLETIEGLKNGEFTSREVTRACLDQIEKHDNDIHAFVHVEGQGALLAAEAADKEISEKGVEAFENKPLLGVPYACKDNFCTKGIETTASSNILKGFIPPYESTVTKRLQDAGAVLLGKTNLDAFAHGSSTETSDFFTTLNPWDTSRVAGGSSGGSAAAVASNMAIFAIGSETAGSIRGPAAWCGISGIKPTYGRVSRYGVIAMASSTDSPGPLAKNIQDATYVLEVISGNDPFDATSSNEEINFNYSNLQEKSLSGIKIGKPASYFSDDIEPETKKQVINSLSYLGELGAEIVDIDLLDPKYSIAVYTILQRSEVSSNLARFSGVRYGKTRDNFNEENKKRIMLGSYSLSSGYYDQYYSKAQKVRTLIIEDFERVFKEVDVIVSPSMPSVALKVGESEKSPLFGELADVLNEASSVAGLAAVSVPCGFSKGLPIGMQIIGPQFSEKMILDVAHRFQLETEFHNKFAKLGE